MSRTKKKKTIKVNKKHLRCPLYRWKGNAIAVGKSGINPHSANTKIDQSKNGLSIRRLKCSICKRQQRPEKALAKAMTLRDGMVPKSGSLIANPE